MLSTFLSRVVNILALYFQPETTVSSNISTKSPQHVIANGQDKCTDLNIGSSKRVRSPMINNRLGKATTTKATSEKVRQVPPSLDKLRSGSFCDVKTFTSGRILDLLSSVDEPKANTTTTTTSYGNHLEVNNYEKLKYCRYLRSPSMKSINELHDSDEVVPDKFKPSKNIIIGHTKITFLS